MPPAPVKIERIAGDRTRQNTFHKRKLGLIKKAIELTVLCDCDIAIIMRSGPTIMCPEGKMSAYSNKDLDAMIAQYMTEPPEEIYSNAEYSRLSKGETSFPQSHQAAAPAPAAHKQSLPAIEVDVEAGAHAHIHSEEEEDQLKDRLASMEAELEKLRNVVASGTSAGEIAMAVQNAAAMAEESAQEEPRVGRKRSPPPLACDEISKPIVCNSPSLAAGFAELDERESKRQCRQEEECPPPFLFQAGVGREVSWDLSQFYSSAPAPLETLNSPFQALNTPLGGVGCPLFARG